MKGRTEGREAEPVSERKRETEWKREVERASEREK